MSDDLVRRMREALEISAHVVVVVVDQVFVRRTRRVVRGCVRDDPWIVGLLVPRDAVAPPPRIWQYCHSKMDNTISSTKSLIDQTTWRQQTTTRLSKD